jgi:hypothetical protein
MANPQRVQAGQTARLLWHFGRAGKRRGRAGGTKTGQYQHLLICRDFNAYPDIARSPGQIQPDNYSEADESYR